MTHEDPPREEEGEGPFSASPDALVQTFSRLVHEVKTPLAAMRSLAQGLGYEPAVMADPAAREIVGQYTERMVHEVDRLVRLLDSFKHVSKPRHHPKLRADLRELVAMRLHDAFAHLATGAGVRFRLRVLDDLRVEAESDEVFQVLTNLVANALRATPVGGQVSVTVQREATMALVTVEDTGSGISDETLAAVQAGVAPERPQGSGIGLLVVRAIVRKYGGRFDVGRREKGGTIVSVRWPIDVR